MSLAYTEKSTNVPAFGALQPENRPAARWQRGGLLDWLRYPLTRAERVAEAFLMPHREVTPPAIPDPGGPSLPLLVPDFSPHIVARVWGQGPTVLLVHGWDANLHDMGAFVSPLLKAGFRVVAYDAPGHGRSSGEMTSLPEMAAAVLAVGRAAGPLAGVIGHSLGAAAILLALDAGLAVDRVVMLGTPADPVLYARDCARAHGLSPEETRDMLALLDAQLPLPISNLSLSALAARQSRPALFVQSTSDRIAPVSEALHTAAMWRGAQVRLVDGVGHRSMLLHADVLSGAISFLS
jgi:pimeloyl-ACP methyl ester carboxylesterase